LDDREHTAGALGQVARKQRFLGAPLHFHPLDAFVYQQILYEVRPDLVVITGDVIGTCPHERHRLACLTAGCGKLSVGGGAPVWCRLYARLPPGGVQGWRACSHAQPGCPTRGAPPLTASPSHAGGTCLFTAFWLEVLNPDANVRLCPPSGMLLAWTARVRSQRGRCVGWLKQVLLIDPLTLSDAVMNKVPQGAKNPEAFPYWHTRVIPLMGDPLEEDILNSVRVCCWRELCMHSVRRLTLSSAASGSLSLMGWCAVQVSEYVGNVSKVLVMLGSSIDSREVRHHLNAYHRFVSEDSYLIVQDTFHGNAEVATKAFLSERKVSAHCPCPRSRAGRRDGGL